MTPEEKVRAVFARYAEGDFAASLPLLDPSIALVIDRELPDSGPFFGLEGVREYMTRFLDSYDGLTLTGEEFESSGDTVLVRVRQDAVGRSSGAPATLEYFQLWTFRGEKVVHLEVLRSDPRPLQVAVS